MKRHVLLEEESELLNIQRKILLFIAKLSYEYSIILAESTNTVEPVLWSKTPHLKVGLPFEDHSLNVYLDRFVPRIIEIALNCSDRKTKIVACELLHSIILLILGLGKYNYLFLS